MTLIIIIHNFLVTHPLHLHCRVDIPHYRIEFLNYNNGVATQLSVDQYCVPPLYIVAMCIWVIGFIIHAVAHYRDPNHHPGVKLFHLSFLCIVVALIFHTIHWSIYNNNGIGVPGLEKFAYGLDIIGIILLWFHIAFICQGYGISKAFLSEKRLTKIAGLVFIGLFSVAYIAMELWYYLGSNPASTKYIFDSTAGLIVLILQVLYALWALYHLVVTYQAEDGTFKRKVRCG